MHTVGDLAGADLRSLERALGSFGAAVSRLARGEDLREVEPYREPVSWFASTLPFGSSTVR